jgi:hypothetical protein
LSDEPPQRAIIRFPLPAKEEARMLAAVVVLAALVAQVPAPASPPAAAPTLTDAQIEDFLLHAKIGKTHTLGKGVTLAMRAVLKSDTMTHDAQIQNIDQKLQQFDTGRGVEFNFRDSWMYNVAAYRIDRLIGLNMVPVTVARRYGNDLAAFTWWIDDVMMEEGARLKQKKEAPDTEKWNEQMQLVRVFDQLIANTDRNVGNLLITSDWRIWPIDHTRAFRLNKEPKSLGNVTRCDREVLQKMKALDKETLKKSLHDVLTGDEMDALLARRDAIVKHIEAAGPGVLFTRNSLTRTQP